MRRASLSCHLNVRNFPFLSCPRLQRATTDAPRRLALAAAELPQQRLHVLDDAFKTPGPHPAAHLLVGRRPGRKIVRNHSPLVAALHDVANGVEDSPKIMPPEHCCRYGSTADTVAQTHHSSSDISVRYPLRPILPIFPSSTRLTPRRSL